MEAKTSFKETFESFLSHNKTLKTVSVASSDAGTPNSAIKMLIDIVAPNIVYLLDYKFTKTYANLLKNHKLSISFMNDDSFTGYRMTGHAEVLKAGEEFERVKQAWEKRLVAYEAERIIKRIQGLYSSREAENSLPKDFVIIKVIGKEAAVIKADRVFLAINHD